MLEKITPLATSAAWGWGRHDEMADDERAERLLGEGALIYQRPFQVTLLMIGFSFVSR